MSLDVYLKATTPQVRQAGNRIFIREGGSTREISRAEWDERFPGAEPVQVIDSGSDADPYVFEANVTHNLGRMAAEAGIYDCLWRPDENNITKASQLIDPLRAGIALLKAEPARFKAHNPSNGWGSYDGFVPWLERYLAACEQHPDAEVSVCR